jgi:hypothetical protein
MPANSNASSLGAALYANASHISVDVVDVANEVVVSAVVMIVVS